MEPTVRDLANAIGQKFNIKLSEENLGELINTLNEWLVAQQPIKEYKTLIFNTDGDSHMGFAEAHMETWENKMNEMANNGYTLHSYMEEGCIMERPKRFQQ